jgi:hypothetical protein
MAFDDKSIKVVVGIDFGTSRSGYAYAFTGDNKIIPKTLWFGQMTPYVKTLTQLLYSPDRKEKYWGYDARMTLAEKRKAYEAKNYHFFQNFKMQLHEGQDRTEDGPRITSANGEKFLVIDLIADSLRFLKDEALKEIKEATSGYLKENNIRWCLTVPAIWTDADKQLMRRAAQKAGLIGTSDEEAERLILVLEPEAAVVYCQEKDQQQLKVGTRFMVVDCGGSTVDITVHEVITGNKLIEVVGGTGGAYGSTYVDKYFLEEFLPTKLTSEVIYRFHDEEPVDFLNMMEEWEKVKCNFDPSKDKDPYFLISIKLYKILQQYCPEVLDRLASEQDGDDKCIELPPNTMKAIFKSTLDGLVEKVNEMFSKLDSRGCDILYLVGGFSTSPLLQERIREEFGSRVKKIVIPPVPGAAIVEGAVSFGMPVVIISCRPTRLTYGTNTCSIFDPDRDPISKKFWADDQNEYYCRDRFSVFVEAGDHVGVDEKVKKIYTLAKHQKALDLTFYATTKRHPRYIDEEGIIEIGKLRIERTDTSSGLYWQVEVTMYFGRTEIQLEAKDVESGKVEKTSLRFSSIYSPELIGE